MVEACLFFYAFRSSISQQTSDGDSRLHADAAAGDRFNGA